MASEEFDEFALELRKQMKSIDNVGRWREAEAQMAEESSEFFESLAMIHLDNLVKIANLSNGMPDPYGNTKLTGRLSMTKSALDTVDYIVTIVSAIRRMSSSQSSLTHYVTNSANVMQRDLEDSFVMSYSNVSNVVVKLAGKNENNPAILISAHYDTVVYSPGASDNGAMVGVALEMMRALANRDPLEFPVIFLFDDAEEGGISNLFCLFVVWDF